jgi:ribosomal protein S1
MLDISNLTVPAINAGDVLTLPVIDSDRKGSWLDHPVRAVFVPDSLIPGEDIEVKVIVAETEEGHALGDVAELRSYRQVQEIEGWVESREPVELTGLRIQFKDDREIGIVGNLSNGFPCFIPRSAISSNPQSYLGRSLKVMLTHCGSTNATGTEKGLKALERAQDAAEEEIVLTPPLGLSAGDLVTGTIERIIPAGITVLLDNGFQAFCPTSLSCQQEAHLLSEGDRYSAEVIECIQKRSKWSIIIDRERVVWRDFAFNHRPGRFVTVEVAAHVDFKAGKSMMVRVVEGKPEWATVVGVIFPRDVPKGFQIPPVGTELVAKVVKVRGKLKKAEFSLMIIGE